MDISSRLYSAIKLSHRLHSRCSPITMVTVPGMFEAVSPSTREWLRLMSPSSKQRHHSVASLLAPQCLQLGNLQGQFVQNMLGFFFPHPGFLENKTKKRIKQRLMFLPEFLLVFRGKKTKTKNKPPTKKTNKPTKPLNRGSKAFNPT